jgi:hypothetical protein
MKNENETIMLTNHFLREKNPGGTFGFPFWTFLKMSKIQKNPTNFCRKV